MTNSKTIRVFAPASMAKVGVSVSVGFDVPGGVFTAVNRCLCKDDKNLSMLKIRGLNDQ